MFFAVAFVDGKEMATHSSILAWRIPWTEELGGLQSTGPKESDKTERLHFHFHTAHSFPSKEQAFSTFTVEVNICSDFGAQENQVCHCFDCFPIYLSWSDGTGCHDLAFWMLSLMPTFSLLSFSFIKKLFSSSLLSANRVVSSVYVWLMIILPAVLIPVCASSSPNFTWCKVKVKVTQFWPTLCDPMDYTIHGIL